MSLRPGSNLKRCVEDLEMSVELLEELSCPFEKWRSVAELGTALIRYGHEDDGRRKVVEAVRGFETLGARPWADRIRGQLLGGEPARQAPSLRTVLSPAELRVAVAIASGDDGPLEVKKIAELLYVSPKTVEFHLTNIYRKASLASGAKLRDRVRAEEGLAPESLGAGREASHDNG
jgi:DNA-binding CsgD family transcriptional regulator